jgi:hypothetical protein
VVFLHNLGAEKRIRSLARPRAVARAGVPPRWATQPFLTAAALWTHRSRARWGCSAAPTGLEDGANAGGANEATVLPSPWIGRKPPLPLGKLLPLSRPLRHEAPEAHSFPLETWASARTPSWPDHGSSLKQTASAWWLPGEIHASCLTGGARRRTPWAPEPATALSGGVESAELCVPVLDF